jgi:hypothetical protein
MRAVGLDRGRDMMNNAAIATINKCNEEKTKGTTTMSAFLGGVIEKQAFPQQKEFICAGRKGGWDRRTEACKAIHKVGKGLDECRHCQRNTEGVCISPSRIHLTCCN